MKKYYLLFSLLFSLYSCQNDDFLNQEEKSSTSLVKSTVLSTDPISELISQNIPVTITLAGETSKFMAARRSSGQVQLDGADSGSGREQWYIKQGINGISYLQVVGGYHKGWRNLVLRSVNETSAYVTGDDGFSNQNYYFNTSFENILNTNRYLISVGRDKVSRSDTYLTVVDNRVQFKNKGVARQQWIISPIGDYELIDIKYELISSSKLSVKPVVIGTRTFNNQTPLEVKRNIQITESIENSSSFSNTYGLSISTSISSSFSTGIPVLAEGKINVNISTTEQWGYNAQKAEKKTRTIAESFEQTLKPYQTIQAKVISTVYDVDAIYIATMRSVKNPSIIIHVRGKWSGIQSNDSRIDLYDITNNSNTFIRSVKCH